MRDLRARCAKLTAAAAALQKASGTPRAADTASLARTADGSGSGDVRARVLALEAALAAAHAETKRLAVKNEELLIARNTMLEDMQVKPRICQCCSTLND